jgi:hypothetical protein
MPSKALVLDANILVRAVLGKRVRELMEAYSGRAAFFVPEAAYAEAEEHLSALVAKRGGDPQKGPRLPPCFERSGETHRAGDLR